MPESEPGTRDLIGTSLSPSGFACTLSSAFNDIVKGAGNADAVANLEAMIGGIERDDEVMVHHRALRRLRRCGARDRANAQEGNQRQSGEALSHSITFQSGPYFLARAGEAGACFGPMFSEEMSITYV